MANGMRIESSKIRQMPVALQEQVAMQLLENAGIMDSGMGMTLTSVTEEEKILMGRKPVVTMETGPAAPGHKDLFNISEMSFQNGEAHRSDQVLQILLDRQANAIGEVREELTHLIEIVRRL